MTGFQNQNQSSDSVSKNSVTRSSVGFDDGCQSIAGNGFGFCGIHSARSE